MLTEEQSAIITTIAESNVLSNSVPGSGKTYTALEIARRYPSMEILMLTYNKALQLEVDKKAREGDISNMKVRTYHSLANLYGRCMNDLDMKKIVDEDKEPIRAMPHIDILIIDEAQDMSMLYYALIRKMMRDGVSDARLLIMGDVFQAVYEFKDADSRYLSLAPHLFPGGAFSSVPLTISHRIPPMIAAFINRHVLKRERIKSSRPCPGERVDIWLGNPFDHVPSLAVHLHELIRDGTYRHDQIFILARSVRYRAMKTPILLLENRMSSLNSQDRLYPAAMTGEMDTRDNIKGKLVFGTCHSTKGLERELVVLFLDSRDSEGAIVPNHVYVAMTRASRRLIIVCESIPAWMDKEGLKESDAAEIRDGDIRKEKEGKPLVRRVTDLIRFIPLESLSSLPSIGRVERDYAGEMAAPVSIPSAIDPDGKGEVMEDVAHLNGIAIPWLCIKHMYGVDLFERYAKGMEIRPPEGMDPLAQALYISNHMEAKERGIKHPLIQIDTRTSWLSDELVERCSANMKGHVKRTAQYEVSVSKIIDVRDLLGDEVYELEEGSIPSKGYRVIGRVDFLHADEIIECKCKRGGLTMEDKLQLAMYCYLDEKKRRGKLINLFTGEIIIIDEKMEVLEEVIRVVIRKSMSRRRKDDDAFLSMNEDYIERHHIPQYEPRYELSVDDTPPESSSCPTTRKDIHRELQMRGLSGMSSLKADEIRRLYQRVKAFDAAPQRFYLFIDTETTGLTKHDEIIEIAWVLVSIDGGREEIIEERSYLLKGDRRVRATAIHGITQKMVDQEGIGADEVRDLLLRVLDTFHPIVVGHNISFDINMVKRSLGIGIDLSICTMGLARRDGLPMRLVSLYEELFPDVSEGMALQAHRALADAKMSMRCYFHMRPMR